MRRRGQFGPSQKSNGQFSGREDAWRREEEHTHCLTPQTGKHLTQEEEPPEDKRKRGKGKERRGTTTARERLATPVVWWYTSSQPQYL